ncbi:hypothetical protein B0T16DRAFT_244595 [Cercophora newfieldiana]|uniref:C2H2-type domain-containing protein n=1 Tax=Cercophora newfieldiana TaxID=92897 RepID=A0AA40CJ54_9PEZI|nr:hypothetical protein B0T16DRAFT_244595 [Cercophora newfieldiana]
MWAFRIRTRRPPSSGYPERNSERTLPAQYWGTTNAGTSNPKASKCSARTWWMTTHSTAIQFQVVPQGASALSGRHGGNPATTISSAGALPILPPPTDRSFQGTRQPADKRGNLLHRQISQFRLPTASCLRPVFIAWRTTLPCCLTQRLRVSFARGRLSIPRMLGDKISVHSCGRMITCHSCPGCFHKTSFLCHHTYRAHQTIPKPDDEPSWASSRRHWIAPLRQGNASSPGRSAVFHVSCFRRSSLPNTGCTVVSTSLLEVTCQWLTLTSRPGVAMPRHWAHNKHLPSLASALVP